MREPAVAGRALVVSLVCVVAAALVAPTTALALSPSKPTATTEEATFASPTSARIFGEVNPGLQVSEYRVGASLANSTWCTSGGSSGSPEQTSPWEVVHYIITEPDGEQIIGEVDEGDNPTQVGALSRAFAPAIVMSGLTEGEAYCFELLAKNGSGQAAGGQVRYIVGAPGIEVMGLSPRTATTSTVTARFEPGYSLSTLIVSEAEYAPASSEWCTSGGASGSPTSTTGPGYYGGKYGEENGEHGSFEMEGLTSKTRYCVDVKATANEDPALTTHSPQMQFTAGAPKVYAHGANQTGPESAVAGAEINSAGQPGEYQIGYGLASSTWCTSDGSSGSPEHVTPATKLGENELSGAAHVKPEVTGLSAGSGYCGAVIATNGSGTSDGGQFMLPMGAPSLFIESGLDASYESETPTGVATYELEFEVNPHGEQTEYDLEYGRTSSEWCRKEGLGGSPEASSPSASLGATDFSEHNASAVLQGLAPDTYYCIAVNARDASGAARRFVGKELTWIQNSVTVKLAGSGSGTVSGFLNKHAELGPQLICPGACSLAELISKSVGGTSAAERTATLTATPAAGSTFTGWSGGHCAIVQGKGGCCKTSEPTCETPLGQTVTATFALAGGSSGGGSQGAGAGKGVPGVGGAPGCTLTPSASIKQVKPGKSTKGKHPRKAKTNYELTASVRCDQSANVILSGKLTETLEKKGRSKAGKHKRAAAKVLGLSAVHAGVQPDSSKTLALKLPAAAFKALRRHTQESVSLSLSATGAGGTAHLSKTSKLRA